MSGPIVVVLASANPHKAREIRDIVEAATGGAAGARVELLERPGEVPDVDETGSTLLENARLKAFGVMRATGLPALADDTGLEVTCLGGEPGVHSARYAGEAADSEANVTKLLTALEGSADRSARFRTVAVLAFPDGRELVAEGIIGGVVATAARGEGGFGYDAVFLPDGGGGRSFAEMTPDDKHALSHRGLAVRALVRELVGSEPGPPPPGSTDTPGGHALL